MAPIPPYATDRQALIAFTTGFLGLLQESPPASGEADTALAALVEGIVRSGVASYQPGTIAAASLTPQGALRVETTEQMAPRTQLGPWGGAHPWQMA